MADGKGTGEGIFKLIGAIEAEARARGASEVVIRGSEVLNNKLFNPKIAERMGYIYKEIDSQTFELIKKLK